MNASRLTADNHVHINATSFTKYFYHFFYCTFEESRSLLHTSVYIIGFYIFSQFSTVISTGKSGITLISPIFQNQETPLSQASGHV